MGDLDLQCPVLIYTWSSVREAIHNRKGSVARCCSHLNRKWSIVRGEAIGFLKKKRFCLKQQRKFNKIPKRSYWLSDRCFFYLTIMVTTLTCKNIPDDAKILLGSEKPCGGSETKLKKWKFFPNYEFIGSQL